MTVRKNRLLLAIDSTAYFHLNENNRQRINIHSETFKFNKTNIVICRQSVSLASCMYSLYRKTQNIKDILTSSYNLVSIPSFFQHILRFKDQDKEMGMYLFLLY